MWKKFGYDFICKEKLKIILIIHSLFAFKALNYCTHVQSGDKKVCTLADKEEKIH